MLITPTRFLLPFTAALLAAGFTASAQTGSAKTDTYLAEFRKENNRHADAMNKLQNDRLDAAKQHTDEAIDCSAIKGQAEHTACLEKATDNYRKAIRKIEKDENAERTLHEKNLNDLRSTMNAYCDRPDCVNSSPGQRTHCTNGTCSN